MNVLIIEDEPLVARDLQKHLQRLAPDAQVLATLESVEEGIAWFKQHPEPDLIFSDIQLADGVSFDIFRQVKPQCPIIFTTAYDEYALQAFKLNSIDYLLKPIDPKELEYALAQFRSWIVKPQQPDYSAQLSSLLTDLAQPGKKKYKERFTAHFGHTLISVPKEQVAAFTRETLIFLVTTDNRTLVTDYKSLEELEDLLDPKLFFRANRQTIIHLTAIGHLEPHYTGKIIVTMKAPIKLEVTVSREKAGQFKSWFEEG